MPSTAQQRKDIARAFVDEVHIKDGQTAEVDKNELETAAGDAYDWAESNQASYNAALSQPFKGVATTKQKAALLTIAIAELTKVS